MTPWLPAEDPEGRYEVTFRTGPPGFADSTLYRHRTLDDARKRLRHSRENNDPHFRRSKITDLVTGEQLT